MSAYLEQYRLLHEQRVDYGSTSTKRAPYILPHVRALKPQTVIDYGAGTSALWALIEDCGVGHVWRYDPGIPKLSRRPKPAELLVSIDMLEHVPIDELDGVISDMASLSKRAVIIIDGHLAKTILPNGDNAHATVRPAVWWHERLRRHYPYVERIWGVRRRPASFRTWRLRPIERLFIGAQIAKYRVLQPIRLA